MIVGGFIPGPGYSGSALIYDPVAGTWGSTGPLLPGRANHTATLLKNGKVLIAGGLNDTSGALGDCLSLLIRQLETSPLPEA